jgi:hypothetical protein
MQSLEFLLYFLFYLAFPSILKNFQALSHLYRLLIRVFILVAVVGRLILCSCTIARNLPLLRRIFLSCFFRGLSLFFLETKVTTPPVLALALLASQVCLSQKEEV